jgi:hypothetical protein
MHNPIITLASFIFMAFFLSSSSIHCTKEIVRTETLIVRDTAIVRDTTVTPTDTTIKLSKGLLVYYPFSNNAGDSSGNGRNGVVRGNLQYATDKNSKSNSAALFDGTSAYISLADDGNLSPASVTICTEFYVTAAKHQNLFGKLRFSDAANIAWGTALFGTSPSYTNSASFAVRGPAACGMLDNVGYSDLIYSMEDIQVNRWYHIACVFDKSIQKIYLNGKLRHAVTREFQTPKQCTDASLIVGGWFQGSPFYFTGKMDEFRVYNRALNDLEIAQLGKGF